MITRVDERSPETSMTESVMGPCADGGGDGASAMIEAMRMASAAVKKKRFMGSSRMKCGSRMKSRQVEIADEDLDHAPADADVRRAAARCVETDVDVAGPSHLHTLLAEDLDVGARGFDQPVADEICAQRAARRSGGGIFGDPRRVGREHSRIHLARAARREREA